MADMTVNTKAGARPCPAAHQQPRGGDGALPRVPDAADLLAGEHEPEDQYRDPGRAFTLWPRDLTFAELRHDPDRSKLVHGLRQLDHLRGDEYRDLGRGGAAGGLCLQPLSFHGRQAPVLLAADQPHGPARRVRAAVLPALFLGWACSTRISRWRWRTRCSTCRWRCGSSKGSCAACPRKSTRPPISTATASRFFVKIFMPLIASGIGVAAFFCFMFSWVELLLSRTLTSVDAKPIAATMTRTVSASGFDWGVLAAAGVLTIVPGRFGDLLRA